MVTVGVIARFEAKPGTQAEMEHFFRSGLSIVERQPSTTVWFAFRTGPTSYGAFAAFETDSFCCWQKPFFKRRCPFAMHTA